MAITGTLTGAGGGAESVSSPFQVSGCAGLPFAPKLTASAGGKGSRVNGTNFAVKLETAGLGHADIAKVDLQIPAVMPARLTTLQKACTEAVFNANPASCSPESVIGFATIHTPVLKSPLSGPAYLVSHGGASFPDVEFLLQGEGIEILLDGKTDIKHGITYSRFDSAPDAPFTTFETVLPAGPHSALSAYGTGKEPLDICSQTVQMPTEIIAQNGAVLKQSTTVTKTGCGAVKSYKATRAQKLAKALATCRKKYKHRAVRRRTCERSARKAYGRRTTSAKRARPRAKKR